MIFLSEPNMHIFDFKTTGLICKFDENGEFKTEDEKLIEKLKPHFKVKEAEEHSEKEEWLQIEVKKKRGTPRKLVNRGGVNK